MRRLAERRVFDVTRLLLEKGSALAEQTGAFDFDDMCYLPVRWGLPFPQYDFVFVDEAQDVDTVQRAIIRRVLRPGGRLAAVGDPGQAIYGFRGAGTDSLQLLDKAFDAVELPLTVSFRCSRSVVLAARPFMPRIEAAPTAPEGSVSREETADGLLDEELLLRYTLLPEDVLL
eukprot:606671-Prymnesium_polylepis.1